MKDGLGFSDDVSFEIIENNSSKKIKENILDKSILDLKKEFTDKGIDISKVLATLSIIFKNIGEKDV